MGCLALDAGFGAYTQEELNKRIDRRPSGRRRYVLVGGRGKIGCGYEVTTCMTPGAGVGRSAGDAYNHTVRHKQGIDYESVSD